MTRSSRFLGSAAPPPTEEILAAETYMIVILSALLCALITISGLAAVARCAWLRRVTAATTGVDQSPPPSKGLKKKALQRLPKSTFTTTSGEVDSSSSSNECAICLTEFSNGEEIRILPLCNHAFHVACIDKWLSSKSSCPSCRRILVPVKCDRCGLHASTVETQIKDQHPSQFTSSIVPVFLA